MSTMGASGRLEPYTGGTRMNVERDAFRTTLRQARLCLELDCNTIFDSARNRECPTCGSAEAYPLESWLNRHRLHALDHRPATGFPRTAATVRGRARMGALRSRHGHPTQSRTARPHLP
jgi:hypothetical protein